MVLAVFALELRASRNEASVRFRIADKTGVDLIETDWRCRER